MTVSGWLHARTPVPPPALRARIDGSLGARALGDASTAATVLLDAADELLRELLGRPSEGRESAIDLLTVDALVTYAFEAASVFPETLDDRAKGAMQRFAAAAA